MASITEDLRWRVGPSASASISSPMKVLVVDDRMAMIHTLSRMFGTLGYQVEPACGAVAALHSLRKSRYDLVVTELRTAHMDGFSLSAWLKDKFEGTRVIIMTDLDSKDIEPYKSAGVVDRWLFKPFRMEDLLGVLGEMLQAPPS